MATQFRLFDPWEDARRSRPAPTVTAVEQLVLDLALRSGGDVDGSEVYRAGEQFGIGADELSTAVASLAAARRLRLQGTRLVLTAA